MGLPARKQVDLLDAPESAAALLDPIRRKLVESLRQPNSAAGLARQLQLPRQKINYHLRELEGLGLVEQVEERRKGNCTERIVRATATSYLINPEVLGELGADPASIRDRFSWAYLVAVASRAIRDLSVLRRRADRVDRKLPTFTLEVDVRFSTPGAQHAFVEALSNEVARLAAKYHDEQSAGGRLFRLFMGSYPVITKTEEEAEIEAGQAEGKRQDGLQT